MDKMDYYVKKNHFQRAFSELILKSNDFPDLRGKTH